MPKRRRLKIIHGFLGRTNDTLSDPCPRTRLIVASKRFRERPLSPATEAGVRVRCAEIKLLASETEFVRKLLTAGIGNFARHDKQVRANNDANPVSHA